MAINETVLEMHFHAPVMELIRKKLGLGKGKFNFYKYSPQNECYVGFDQAYVKTDLSEKALLNKFKTASIRKGYALDSFMLGIFLQYKVVTQLKRRSRYTPSKIKILPHMRVSLDTVKNHNTGFSQHELLFNLNKNQGALVYYACPMLFDRVDLYKNSPDISLLRLADLSSAPSNYTDNENHFIYFENITSSPIWCSEPIEGSAISVETLADSIVETLKNEDYAENQQAIFQDLIKPLSSHVNASSKVKKIDELSQAYTIIEFISEGEMDEQEF
jgi:hypothetical protein